MNFPIPSHPRLRPVEVFPTEEHGQQILVLHDPTGLADGSITVTSQAALYLFQMMDGQHDIETLIASFESEFGQPLPRKQIEDIVTQLDVARYLDSPSFNAHYQTLVEAYRASPARISPSPESFGADERGLGPVIVDTLASATSEKRAPAGMKLAGLIAPHLDYPRGQPCYADAYNVLAQFDPPERFVILGTNHSGRGTSVVGTNKPFHTPFGITPNDRDFLQALSDRCHYDLCENDFDHRSEHSIELQVLILQHLFGSDTFEIVPLLCHDPCGPNGTGPYDGHGVDLRVFGEALGELVREDKKSTVIIAGADLSHVGRHFGDNRELDETFLQEVESKDREALEHLERGHRDAFLNVVANRQNDTRICSVGCIYALMTALPHTKPTLLRYHQAVDAPSGTAVTCSAATFWAP